MVTPSESLDGSGDIVLLDYLKHYLLGHGQYDV